MNSLGDIIRKLREEKQLPLRVVAAFLDIDQAILSKIERGQRKPTREQALQVAEERVAYLTKPALNKVSLINLIKSILTADGRVAAAWLFGSMARGEDTSRSDIDIMVELNDAKKYSMFDLIDIAFIIENKIKRKVDLVEKGYLKDFAMQTAATDLVQSATQYQFLIIGEAIRHIDDDILAKYPYPWHIPRSFRNFIIHVYHGIKMERIYSASQDLDELEKQYTINTNGQHIRVEEWKEVDSVIQAYRKDISKRRFFVISDSRTSYGDIIRLLSILKDAHINNYRVMNLGTTFQQEVPVPAAAIQPSIDGNKLVLTGAEKALYSTFKPVIDVLKKHDYWQFQVKKQ
ncbi:hypothetical protein F5148DRAFT_1154950 [Russula earlei]|uniref:Uncharacterized protein n=1 Tax=Russula earlei TaxID=71964 RepID=A0ACC0TQX5_9AGAM|nr:hypothetical protein F5148DRAFT_1154950 [Russula earlei]